MGNKLVYNHTYARQYQDEISSTFNLIRVILGESICANLLFSLMCNHMFPQCLRTKNKNYNPMLPQQICAETCELLHDNICKQNLNEFGEMVLRFESITLDPKIKKHMSNLLVDKCNDRNIFPPKYMLPTPECFMSECEYKRLLKRTEKCSVIVCIKTRIAINGNTSLKYGRIRSTFQSVLSGVLRSVIYVGYILLTLQSQLFYQCIIYSRP